MCSSPPLSPLSGWCAAGWLLWCKQARMKLTYYIRSVIEFTFPLETAYKRINSISKETTRSKMSAVTENNKPVLLPAYFPYASPTCKTAAQPFFDCFSKHAVKTDDMDTKAGDRAIALCLKEKSAYEKCMTASELKQAPKRYRVHESYRQNGNGADNAPAAAAMSTSA